MIECPAMLCAEDGEGKGLQYALCGMQGWRKTMEDAHIAVTKVHEREDMCLFAVFDGHGGAEIAKFCSNHLVREFVALSAFSKADYDNALKDAFHRIDTMLLDDSYAAEVQP